MLKDLQSEFYTLLEGGIIVLASYHLAVFIRNKQKIFLYYGLYFFALFCFFFVATSKYLRSQNISYFLGYYASYIFYIQFCRELLQTKQFLKKWDKYLKIALYFAIGVFLFQLIKNIIDPMSTRENSDLYVVYYIVFFIFALISYTQFYKLKNKYAYYLIIGSCTYIVLAFTTNIIFSNIGQKPFIKLAGFDPLLISYTGMYIEAFMFAIIVGEKQTQIENERNLLQVENLKIELEKVKIEQELDILQEELKTYKIKLQNKTTDNNDTTILQLKNKVIINTNDILYIKSDGHYLEYFLQDKQLPIVDRNKLSEIIHTLPQSNFVRIHKSYIVNIAYIKVINATKVLIDNGEWLNLSRAYKDELKVLLNNE